MMKESATRKVNVLEDEYNVKFIGYWIYLQWQVYNFTGFAFCMLPPCRAELLHALFAQLCRYSNHHFVKFVHELFKTEPFVDIKFINGETLMHVICRSKIKADEKAKVIIGRDTKCISKPNKNNLVPLHLAVLNKNPKVCTELMTIDKIDINSVSKRKLTPLHVASHFGMTKSVESLLTRHDIDVSAKDDSGDTPRHHAAGKQQLKTYLLLTEDPRCNTTQCNNRGRTAEDDLLSHLKEYTINRSFDEFEALAKCLRSFHNLDGERKMLIHNICLSKVDAFEKLQYAVHCNSNLAKIRDRHNNLPIHIAARHKDKRLLEHLLNISFDIDFELFGYRNMNPLHVSCIYGYVEHVQLLLSTSQIDINAKDLNGNSPLHIASVKGFYDIMKELRQIPWCRTDIRNNNGKTAADLTSTNVKMIEKVVNGTTQDLKDILHDSIGGVFIDAQSNTLLHICAKSFKYGRDKAQLLVSQDSALLDRRNKDEFLPIHVAAEHNNVEVLEYLASEGHINKSTHEMRNPLHIASIKGHCGAVVRLLMFSNIEVNQRDINGDTAAHLAAMNNHLEILYVLQNHPKYIHIIRNNNNKAPIEVSPCIQSLTVFCDKGSASSVKSMLRYSGKYLSRAFDILLLPIVLASNTEQYEKLKLILDYCSDLLEYVDSHGKGLLHIAIHRNDTHMLKLLLDKPISKDLINRRDFDGYTAWDYACLNIQTECILMLEYNRNFQQSPFGIKALMEEKFIKQQEIRIQQYDGFTWSIHLIRNEIWCCGHMEIIVYCNALEKKRTIPCAGMGHICSLADLSNSVAVAGREGLFIVTHSGVQLRCLCELDVCDVRFYSGLLYFVYGKRRDGHGAIQVCDTQTWQRMRAIETPCHCPHNYFHTLHISSQHITLACRDTHRIYTLTLTGELLHNTKQGDNAGEFRMPRLCHNVNESMLAADYRSHCLQLKHEGVWSPVRLEPQAWRHKDAVYAGGALYMLCDGNVIIKYVPSNINIV